MNKKPTYLFSLLPFLIIVTLFLLVPVVMMVLRSFTPEDGATGFTLAHYYAIFTKKLYQQSIVNSLWVAVCSSVVGLVVAFFGAKAYHGTTGSLKNAFASILNMTSNFAGIPLAFAYIIMLGNVGVFVMFGKNYGIDFLADFNIYSIPGLLLCYVYFQIPLSNMILIPAFDGLRKEWGEAVSLLGGNRLCYWLNVGIPVLVPSLLGTFSVLFANAIAAFTTAYALMQNNFSLLPIRIGEQFIGDIYQRTEFGSALAVVLMSLMVITILINNRILKGSMKGGQA